MATESFIIPENIAHSMERWGEMSWEGVYAEQLPIAQDALREDTRTSHVSEYSIGTKERLESGCAQGLKKLVDNYRNTQKKDATPSEVDWAEFILYHNNSKEIEETLREDAVLEGMLGEDHEMTAINSALAVSERYACFLNERTLATRANGYQSGQ